jgi:hypothetical protein
MMRAELARVVISDWPSKVMALAAITNANQDSEMLSPDRRIDGGRHPTSDCGRGAKEGGARAEAKRVNDILGEPANHTICRRAITNMLSKEHQQMYFVVSHALFIHRMNLLADA